ncbi:MAG: PilZ domain-containing protein [Myxococcota bacterium]
MKTDQSFDRRKYPRVMTESVVSIERVSKPRGLAHALDLSMTGVRFQCVGLDLNPGEIVRVQLNLCDTTVSVVGTLVRVTELDPFSQEVALTFLDVDPETQRILSEALPDGYEIDAS